MKRVVQHIRASWLFIVLAVLWVTVQLLVPGSSDDGVEHRVTHRFLH